jgi:hypothetical protein
MLGDADFSARYRALEERMQTLAEDDGDVFLPGPAPPGPVDFVLVCMEPSLGWWARSADEARAKVAAGFRNFHFSLEDFILHFCARHYLCAPHQQYHLTDLSKGAMLVDRAGLTRVERYDRWFALLLEEIAIVAPPTAGIVAVGDVVAKHLSRRGFGRTFARVMHYSGQAGRARRHRIVGREAAFSLFRDSISMDDILDTAKAVLSSAGASRELETETLARLARNELTESRRQLLFIYKEAFESIHAAARQAV